MLHVRDDLRAQRQSRIVCAVLPQGLRPHRHNETRAELDRGYLISAKDLGAYDHLAEIAEAGIGCLKVEGRKKKPEYVATVTKTYRDFLDRVEQGTFTPPRTAGRSPEPLVQIFSRGFTGGMYGGCAGTRLRDAHAARRIAANRARRRLSRYERGELIVDVSDAATDRRRAWASRRRQATSAVRRRAFSVSGRAHDIIAADGVTRQALETRIVVEPGWRVVRTSEAQLLERARATYAALPTEIRARKSRVDVRVFGSAGTPPLKGVFIADGETDHGAARRDVHTGAGEQAPARCRSHFVSRSGRLGDTPFALGAPRHHRRCPPRPISSGQRALNHLRQQAVDTGARSLRRMRLRQSRPCGKPGASRGNVQTRRAIGANVGTHHERSSHITRSVSSERTGLSNRRCGRRGRRRRD